MQKLKFKTLCCFWQIKKWHIIYRITYRIFSNKRPKLINFRSTRGNSPATDKIHHRASPNPPPLMGVKILKPLMPPNWKAKILTGKQGSPPPERIEKLNHPSYIGNAKPSVPLKKKKKTRRRRKPTATTTPTTTTEDSTNHLNHPAPTTKKSTQSHQVPRDALLPSSLMALPTSCFCSPVCPVPATYILKRYTK